VSPRFEPSKNEPVRAAERSQTRLDLLFLFGKRQPSRTKRKNNLWRLFWVIIYQTILNTFSRTTNTLDCEPRVFVIRSYPLPIKKRRACLLSGVFHSKRRPQYRPACMLSCSSYSVELAPKATSHFTKSGAPLSIRSRFDFWKRSPDHRYRHTDFIETSENQRDL